MSFEYDFKNCKHTLSMFTLKSLKRWAMDIKFSHLQQQTDLIQILFLDSAYRVSNNMNRRVDSTAFTLCRKHRPRAFDVSIQKSALIFLLLTENIWHLNIEEHAVGCCGNSSKRYWRCWAKLEVKQAGKCHTIYTKWTHPAKWRQ